jgi:hypothetical protein
MNKKYDDGCTVGHWGIIVTAATYSAASGGGKYVIT